LVKITLNCQVCFDIGCHEAIITFLMTNSLCTTLVEVTKNIHDSQCQSQPHLMSSCHDKDTDRFWCYGLCQDVITKTSLQSMSLLSEW